MKLQQKQHDNKLSLTRLSINEQGELFQRKGKYRPGYMNQAISYMLFMIALACLVGIMAKHKDLTVAQGYIFLNVAMYSCVIAIMLESKSNQTQGFMIILLMSAFNCLIIILAITKIL